MEERGKFLAVSFLGIVVGTIFGLYVYNQIKQYQQIGFSTYPTEYPIKYGKYPETEFMGNGEILMPHMKMLETKPELMLEITTFEYDSDEKKWTPVLTHTFYGNTHDEIWRLIDVHQKYDSFFKSSFQGEFKVGGGDSIKVKNEDSGFLQVY